MAKKGPILIFEDDPDDIEMLKEAFDSLQIENELKFFHDCAAALNYLKTTPDRPFLILSDINMPGMSGNDLKAEINKDEGLRRKSIPFIFFTTSATNKSIAEAYEQMVQGYFKKGNTMAEIKRALSRIIDYWTVCLHPDC